MVAKANTEIQTTTLAWQHYLFVFMCLWGIWLLLAGNLDVEEVILGAIIAVLVIKLSPAHLGIITGIRFTLMAPISLLLFLSYFAWALVRANFDMARRVLSPSLPIRPKIVVVETQLQSDLGKLLLSTAITLTPGTLSMDVIGQHLWVHWIDCPPGIDLNVPTQKIVRGFEKHLLGFLL